MFMTPYQHGVVREITEHSFFDQANPLFQNYKYAAHDLNELTEAGIIMYKPKLNAYVPGLKWSKVK